MVRVKRGAGSGPAGRACAVALAAAGLLGGGPAAAAAAQPAGLRVVGGTPVASITGLPFQVALYVKSPPDLFGQVALGFCGGVIIDPVQVVTAAHCVIDESTGAIVPASEVTVSAGAAQLSQSVPTQPVAADIAVYPSFNPATAAFDVAVVTLSTPLYSGSPRPDGVVAVAPIPLITPALAAQYANPNASPAQPVVISGWGQTAAKPTGAPADVPGTTLPEQLRAAQTHLVADATCAADYAAFGARFPPLTPQMICAGEPAGGVDVCSGDSGGPLVVDIGGPGAPPAGYVLAGLSDFGAGCAQAGYPGIFVRVAAPEITGFIESQAQAHGQTLSPVPAPPVAPDPAPIDVARPPTPATIGRATLLQSTARVKKRVVRLAVHCAMAKCAGTLTLRSTITLAGVRFALAANTTATVALRITPAAQRQLDRHRHRLPAGATLRTAPSVATHHHLTLTD